MGLETLLSHALFGFLAVVTLGLFVGRFRVAGLSLDSAGVLFVGLIMGFWGVTVPQAFLPWGQALFIFAIGMQSGPGLVSGFRRHGWQMLAVMGAVLLMGAGMTLVLGRLLHLDWRLGTGLFTGALTSTPGLAAAIESTGSPLASIGYGAAYPLGVLSVILFVRLVPRLLHWDFKRAEADLLTASHEHYPRLDHRNFIVQNPSLVDKTLGELDIPEMTGATISRMRQGDLSLAPMPETVLKMGDLIKAVGSEAALEKVRRLVGAETSQKITFTHTYCAKWILVSNRKNVNRSLAELRLLPENRITVTRIRRSGVDIQPGPADRLRLGDRLRVVCHTDRLDWIVKALGNTMSQLGVTDLLPVFIGLGLGLVLGQLTLPLPGLPPFRLGLTGGVLVSGLLLSRQVRTGPLIWSLSPQTHQLLRELGLVSFLAVVGVQAGSKLGPLLNQEGLALLGVSLTIALCSMVAGVLVGRLVFGMNPLTLLGVLTGAMTSTPGLGAAQGHTSSSAPSVAYATVYPMALVGVIVVTRVLAGLGL